MRKYIYFGKLNRNISYRGCSFPVAPGYVIQCHPGFLNAFLPEGQFKETASNAEAKYTFKGTKSVFAQDPSGGMPMRSTDKPAPKKVAESLPSPATVEDKEYAKLYELRQGDDTKDDAKLEESTSVAGKVAAAVDAEVKAQDKAVKKPAKVEEPTKVDEPTKDEKPPEDLPVAKKPGTKKTATATTKPKEAPQPKPTGPAVDQPTKTALRKMRKGDLLGVVGIVVKASAPRHPEMLDALKAFDEETHKTPIFDALWKYYDMDEAE